MDEQRWTQVDDYITSTLGLSDAALDAAVAKAEAAQLPPIAVTAPQGMLLQLIAQIQKARRILELGTLGGYSTIFLARALPPQGRLISLELKANCAQAARASLESAGLADSVEVRETPAMEGLEALQAEGVEPFDLIFLDADKAPTAEYFQHALELSRPGTIIIADNVVRDGQLGDPGTADASAQGMRRFHDVLAQEPRVSATTIQTVGAKGYDGFTIVLVKE